ncbi:hypothetical protein [Aeromicrobium wangtongii]|uniref:hypothetical protein n=1 Tax=Aeromicrobium wangtongii TaxID=2969247 RepID=UPI002017B28B|nr:hypothetical protein [Aeromicrobium wangtongii]MCL3817332.1 hypothetical protein [Aeromicrobium wangtongii]
MADASPATEQRHPAVLILAGTAILGVAGLVVLAAAAAVLGAADYAVFGAFWSALFFAVAILFGGQQETTRAVTSGRTGSTRLVVFAGTLALAAVVVVTGTAVLWVGPAFGDGHGWLVAVVAVGCAGYAVNGVLAGALAGSAHWRAYAALLAVEGVVRTVLVLLALLAGSGVDLVGWAVAAAYPVAILAVGIPAWRGLRSHLTIEESLGRLWIRTGQTMAAAAAVAALVNGFPLLMSLASRGTPADELGALTLAVMLTRAPLLVPLMALQSFLITLYAEGSPWRKIAWFLASAAVASALLGAVAAVIGPSVLDSAFGPDFVLEGHVLGLLVLSSGGLGAMCMVSPAVIVRGMQKSNAIGWLLAAALAVLTLALAPGSLEARVPAALLVGPAVGLLWLLLALGRDGSRAVGSRGEQVHYARDHKSTAEGSS